MRRSGNMWIRDDDNFIDRHFSVTGDKFEIDHLDAALAFMNTYRTAIDVGAHYGSWSRYLARRFSRVISFEPVAETYACCQKNTQDFANIELHNKAVGDKTGRVAIGAGKFFVHPGMETITGFGGDIELVTIDSLNIDDLDFIKVDVEGFELQVLQGARRTLSRCKPIVLFEENSRGPLEHGTPNGSCANYLKTLGAELLQVKNNDFVFGWPDRLPKQHVHTIKNVSEFTQRSDVALLLSTGAIGVELGVAEGRFSESLLKTGRFSHLYSIDMWSGDRGHDVVQYKSALQRLLPFRGQSTALRMTFDEAIDLFPNESFDFIYIDAYAHTGEEGGKIFRQWWPKLKPGGIMAGDDYSSHWPLVVEAVDRFISDYHLELSVFSFTPFPGARSNYPNWIAKKPAEPTHFQSDEIQRIHRTSEENHRAALARQMLQSGKFAEASAFFDNLDFDTVSDAEELRSLHLLTLAELIVRKPSDETVKVFSEAVKRTLQHSTGSSSSPMGALDSVASLMARQRPVNWYGLLRHVPDHSLDRFETALASQTPEFSAAEIFDFVKNAQVDHWQWWAVVYIRLLRHGYVESAYHAKTNAAQCLVDSGEGSDSQIKAARHFLNPAHEQLNGIPLDTTSEYAQLLNGKRVVCVFPNTQKHINYTYSTSDLIVRANEFVLRERNGLTTRTDVLYCVRDFYAKNRHEIRYWLESGALRAVILASDLDRRECSGIKKGVHVVETARTNNDVFLGYGYAGQRIVADLMNFAPSTVHCLGIDFFLGDTPKTGTTVDPVQSYLQHDPLAMWRYLKALRETGRLTTDDFLSMLLDLDESAFLRLLGQRIAPHLYA